jgi:hypothetical protein
MGANYPHNKTMLSKGFVCFLDFFVHKGPKKVVLRRLRE